MNPASALHWEIWQRNRWGFALLVLVLAICLGLAWQARRLHDRATLLAKRDPNRLVITSERLFTGAETERTTQTVRLTQGRNLLYDGPVHPDESLLVQAIFDSVPELRVSLQSKDEQAARVLFQGQLRSRVLAWSTATGQTGSIALNFNSDFPQELGLAHLSAESWQEAGLFWSIVLFAFGFLVILGVSAAAEPHARLGFTGIPPRRFTLPVSTATLAAIPLVWGALSTGLFYLAWARIISGGLLVEGTAVPNAYYAAVLVTGVILFQALVWGLPSFPKTRAWLITFLVLGLLFLGALPSIARNSSEGLDWQTLQPRLLAGLIVAAMFGATAAVLGVAWERRGAWSAWARRPAWSGSLRHLLPSHDFASPGQAQRWIEWRRNGRLGLGIWIAFVCLLVCSDLLGQHLFGFSQGIGLGGAAAAMWCGIVGLNLARDGALGKLPLSSFTAVRPLTSGALLQAKLIVGAGLWAGAMGLLIVGALISLGTGAGAGSPESELTQFVLLMAISLHLFVGILPFCLLGRVPGFPWSLLPWLLLYASIINAFTWFDRHPDSATLAFGLLTALVTLKLAVAGWGFHHALRARISSWRFVASYTALWLVAVTLLAGFALHLASRAFWSDGMLAIPAAVLLVPLARVALSPLALAVNRHR